jgi:hypothetical protein
MIHTIFSFGIKTEEIKSIFGCKNIIIFNRIKGTRSFEAYKDFLPENFNKTPAQAIEDIVYGKPFDTVANYAYAYALICFCEAFGDVLPYEYTFEERDIYLGAQTDLINTILSNEYGLTNFRIEEKLLGKNTHPFEIPKVDNWPLIGMIKNEELKNLKAKLKHIKIADEKIEKLIESEDENAIKKGIAYQHIQAFINNVNDCIEFGYDYISFAH